jgi:cytochrome c-type biogenesis protein
MLILLLSLISGGLTVFAPCALPMLPIIVGGSLKQAQNPTRRAFIISASLGFSVLIFSLLIKFSSLLIGVDASFWSKVSGSIILVLGIINLFPSLWMIISAKLKLMSSSEKRLTKSYQSSSKLEPVLTGFALGPVFSSCNPIYLFIISILLPQNIFKGIINLLAYCLGLSLMLLLLALGGQKIVTKLKLVANPKSWFRKILAISFIITGILIFTGTDKKIETWALKHNSWFTNYIKVEQELIPN